MQHSSHKLLLPLAVASMISFPTSVRALAFATGPRCSSRGAVLQQALGSCSSGGGCTSRSRSSISTSCSSKRTRGLASRRPRMELALDKPQEATVIDEIKTPSNKLLFAPPKFTPTPYR